MNGATIAREYSSRGDFRPRNSYFFGLLPATLLMNIIVAALVVLIFIWLVKTSKTSKPSSLEILNRRYAAGDIDRETYLLMKGDIGV